MSLTYFQHRVMCLKFTQVSTEAWKTEHLQSGQQEVGTSGKPFHRLCGSDSGKQGWGGVGGMRVFLGRVNCMCNAWRV